MLHLGYVVPPSAGPCAGPAAPSDCRRRGAANGSIDADDADSAAHVAVDDPPLRPNSASSKHSFRAALQSQAPPGRFSPFALAARLAHLPGRPVDATGAVRQKRHRCGKSGAEGARGAAQGARAVAPCWRRGVTRRRRGAAPSSELFVPPVLTQPVGLPMPWLVVGRRDPSAATAVVPRRHGTSRRESRPATRLLGWLESIGDISKPPEMKGLGHPCTFLSDSCWSYTTRGIPNTRTILRGGVPPYRGAYIGLSMNPLESPGRTWDILTSEAPLDWLQMVRFILNPFENWIRWIRLARSQSALDLHSRHDLNKGEK